MGVGAVTEGLGDCPILGAQAAAAGASVIDVAAGVGAVVHLVIARNWQRGVDSPAKTAAEAGTAGTVGFEVFKQVAWIYLRAVVTGPAREEVRPGLGSDGVRLHHRADGAVSTAWAAKAKANLARGVLQPPAPADINTA